MKSQYRVVVVGGGIVGASVLYHLARLGWTDCVLVERAELTAGSTWHAAAGCHTYNSDATLSELQAYTIGLYPEIEAESGQDVRLILSGGISLAATAERWDWLRAEHDRLRAARDGTELLAPDEIMRLCPIVESRGLFGGLFDPLEGRLDPHGATHAYVTAARRRGAEVALRNRVLGLRARPAGGWDVETEQGTVAAEHVVNAAGLWARRVGRMAGVDLPLVPMEHHYLVTDDVPAIAAMAGPMPAVVDLEGFTYLQQNQLGVLLGVYEQHPRHWMTQGAAWDYGMDLLPPDMERIEAELMVGFERFPALQEVGIKRWVNGAFTFTPDGNPLVGPVPGLRGYWAACGCMAGFSQSGAIGLALARWMVDGDPGVDAAGMDVARFGAFASGDAYLHATTAQFYARRFVMAYPNEELPAARPLAMTPCHDALVAAGARHSVVWGLEVPAYFAPDPAFVERPTALRSNAHPLVAAECEAVRQRAGLIETAAVARYEVTGPNATAWLDRMVAGHLPAVGQLERALMLGGTGRLVGDFTLCRLSEGRYWLIGPYAAQSIHMRWFGAHQEPGVTVDNVSDAWMGFAIAGPRAHDILSRTADLAGMSLRDCREAEVGLSRAVVAGWSLTGETGYDISVPTGQHRALLGVLMTAGATDGLRPFGLRALESLRLETGQGVWSREFSQGCTPAMAGLDRYLAVDKAGFIGRDAVLREPEPERRIVSLAVDADGADAAAGEPVWVDGRSIGAVTSGAFGHATGLSLALASIEAAAATVRALLHVMVAGDRRSVRILDRPAFDPSGGHVATDQLEGHGR